jgi:hypothetical protein
VLRRLIASCALLATWAVSGTPAAADGPALREAEVRWDANAAEVGSRVAERWPHVHRSVAEQVGFDADLAGVDVVVVRGHDRLREAARADAPAWAAGVTIGAQRIVVRADAPATSKADLEATLRHECVHLLWARKAGPRRRLVPLWFEEGVAEHVGGGVSVAAGARLDVAVGTARLLPLESLASSWPVDATDADLAYQEARRWVDVVVARAGWPAVRRIFERVLEGGAGEDPSRAFERAVLEATGHPVSDWDAEWRLALEERASGWWMWLLGDLGTLLWAALAVTCALVYVFVLRGRRRRQIAELPDEVAVPPPSPAEGGREA